MGRAEDGDDTEAPQLAHGALRDVHAPQPEQQGGHRLGRRRPRRGPHSVIVGTVMVGCAASRFSSSSQARLRRPFHLPS